MFRDRQQQQPSLHQWFHITSNGILGGSDAQEFSDLFSAPGLSAKGQQALFVRRILSRASGDIRFFCRMQGIAAETLLAAARRIAYTGDILCLHVLKKGNLP